MPRFIGNLDLCGRQVNKPCHTSLGFPVVLPHAESDEVAAGILFIFINVITSKADIILVVLSNTMQSLDLLQPR